MAIESVQTFSTKCSEVKVSDRTGYKQPIIKLFVDTTVNK